MKAKAKAKKVQVIKRWGLIDPKDRDLEDGLFKTRRAAELHAKRNEFYTEIVRVEIHSVSK